jgi:DNA-binding response OmpR family regulator
MKILVVDDDNDINDLLSKFFKSKGHDCIATKDGEEGLRLCLNKKFDAIILDLAMPSFTGKNFIDSLTQEGKIDKQKIIILTAMPLGDVKIEDRHHGICEVLQKPCRLDVLLKTVTSLNAVT